METTPCRWVTPLVRLIVGVSTRHDEIINELKTVWMRLVWKWRRIKPLDQLRWSRFWQNPVFDYKQCWKHQYQHRWLLEHLRLVKVWTSDWETFAYLPQARINRVGASSLLNGQRLGLGSGSFASQQTSLSPTSKRASNNAQQETCSLVLIDGYVADVNLERHLLTNWFKVSRIYAIVCSSLSATRFAILYDNDFVEYDCQQRDSIVSGIMHHLEGKSVRIYLGDIHMCRYFGWTCSCIKWFKF